MFDLVQKNKTIVQVVLGLVSLGLVVGFGIGGYSAMQGGENYLAKVGNVRITERELAEATNNQQIQDEMKSAYVEQLVQQQLLKNESAALRLSVSTEDMRALIAAVPEFQTDGKFDPALYKQRLEQQRMTPESFEQKVNNNLVVRQLTAGISQAGFISTAMQDHMEKLLRERRQIQVARISAQDFLKTVTVSDAEIKQYYDAHSAEYKTPEQVKVEYLVLSGPELAAGLKVSDAEVQKYYDDHKKEIAKEERKVRHILLMTPKGAKPEQKAEVKKQAEAVLAEVKQNPARFADIAKQKSQDPGSAAQGGELPWFSHDGSMVKTFEDVVFSLTKGQTSGLVESEYGFHIIKLDDVRVKTLADAKPEIEERLKAQKAQSTYQSQSEKFNELVYQQADSLKPAADAFKLQIRKSDWLSREGGKEPELANPKVAEAAFGDDVLKKKHNSEALEISPGVMVAVRVVDHKPEAVPPLAEVSSKITDKLRMEKATKRAQEEGVARLKSLQAGQIPDLKWEPVQEVMRVGNQQVSDEQLKAIFRVAGDKLPGYAGSEQKDQGFVIYKVVSVMPAEAMSPEAHQRAVDTMSQMYGQLAFTGYLDSLRKKSNVEYKTAAPKAE